MKNGMIAALLVFTLCLALYPYWQKHHADSTGQITAQPDFQSELLHKLNTLAMENESLREIQHQQAVALENLQDAIAALPAPKTPESWSKPLAKNHLESPDDAQANTDNEEKENLGTVEPGMKNIVSDGELGDYIDQSIASGLDELQSNTAWNETQSLLVDMPGVILNDMHCNTEFCSARFSSENGNPPDLDSLWGNPPYMYGGMSEIQQDGSVLLYFAGEGVSLEETRTRMGENQGGSQQGS